MADEEETKRVTKTVGLPFETESPPEPSAERDALRKQHFDLLLALWTQPRICPIDGTDQWAVGDMVETGLRVLPDDPAVSTGTVYVYLPVSCKNCGYTVFFHSGMLEGELRGAAESGLETGADES